MFTMRHVQAFILSALVIVMAGVTTYWIKSKALEKQQRLEVLQSRIETEKDRMLVLEADWSYLTRPDRIQRLSEEMLSFAPVEPQRILSLDHLGEGNTGEAATQASTRPVSAGLFRITSGGITPGDITPVDITPIDITPGDITSGGGQE